MNIILVSHKYDRARTLVLGRGALILLALVLVLVLAGAGATLYRWIVPYVQGQSGADVVDAALVATWQERLQAQQEEVERLRRLSAEQVDALTLKLGEMQARLMRLDALGQRLTKVARLEGGEFDFEGMPALGGPVEEGGGESYRTSDLESALDQLWARLDHRAQQLELLNALIYNRQFEAERFIAGRPIDKGWLSSSYGYRTDPFSGRRAWHAGVDFAGREGSDVKAVAGGVVTVASQRSGYGLLVEISHGDGLVTRYAHCKEILVKVGDLVQKGQTIALMGSTGRSTGPHVHFEVAQNGRQLDPLKYINRAAPEILSP